jgi:hypothetical protein
MTGYGRWQRLLNCHLTATGRQTALHLKLIREGPSYRLRDKSRSRASKSRSQTCLGFVHFNLRMNLPFHILTQQLQSQSHDKSDIHARLPSCWKWFAIMAYSRQEFLSTATMPASGSGVIHSSPNSLMDCLVANSSRFTAARCPCDCDASFNVSYTRGWISNLAQSVSPAIRRITRSHLIAFCYRLSMLCFRPGTIVFRYASDSHFPVIGRIPGAPRPCPFVPFQVSA